MSKVTDRKQGSHRHWSKEGEEGRRKSEGEGEGEGKGLLDTFCQEIDNPHESFSLRTT